MTNLKYLLIPVAAFVTLFGIVYAGETNTRYPKPHATTPGFVAVEDTATSTLEAGKYKMFDYLPEYAAQSTCLRMRSSADGGLLYITGTAAGLAVSATGCGQ